MKKSSLFAAVKYLSTIALAYAVMIQPRCAIIFHQPKVPNALLKLQDND